MGGMESNNTAKNTAAAPVGAGKLTTYIITHGVSEETIQAASLDEARSQAEAWVSEGDWGDEPCIISVKIWATEPDDDEDAGEDTLQKAGWEPLTTVKVAVNHEPEEPDCTEDEHDWYSPEWLGGCGENPGVWSEGGRIKSVEVCRYCGSRKHYRSESLPGQYPEEPARTWYTEPEGGLTPGDCPPEESRGHAADDPLLYNFYGLGREKLAGVHPSERMSEGEQFSSVEAVEARARDLLSIWDDCEGVRYHESGTSRDACYLYREEAAAEEESEEESH